MLKNMAIAPDYRCQLDCSHCSAKKLKSNKEKLTLEKIKEIIDQGHENGALSVTLTGGEPLLYKDIISIIRHINRKGMVCVMNTNGLLCNEKYLKKLKKAGLDIIIISLDCFSKDDFEKFRNNKDIYETVLDAIRLSKQSGLNTIISTTLTRKNIFSKDLENIIDFAKELGINVNLSPMALCGKALDKGWKNNALILDKHKKRMKELLKIKNVRTDTESTYLKKGCAAGSEYIYVTAYGDVLPCDFIQISYGNIKHTRLSKILKKMRTDHHFSDVNDFCLPSFNEKFIKDYIIPTKDKKLPISIKDHPNKLINKTPNMHYNIDPHDILQNNHKKRLFSYLFNRIIPDDKNNLLEVGAGCGYTIPLLKNHTDHLTITDNDEYMLRCQRFILEKYSNRPKIAKSRRLDITRQKIDEKFDVILEIDTLHHISDLKKAISNISSMIDKGAFIATEPNIYNPLIFLQYLLDKNEKRLKDVSMFRLRKLLKKDYTDIKIMPNNIIQKAANPLTLPLVKVMDTLTTIWPFKLLAFNYVIIARK